MITFDAIRKQMFVYRYLIFSNRITEHRGRVINIRAF
jgi:hypothetical protein